MPWQRDLWDVQYELDEDGSLWYREGRITVPRQSAKTTSTLVRQVDRCINSERRGWGRRPVAMFTAQHASDARDKIVNDWMPTVEASAWAQAEGFTCLRSNGREGFRWTNGARMGTFPPNQKGAHGDTLDLVDIDEAFAFDDNRVESGARPAMITRFSPQIVIQSTAGTTESLYFKGKVDDGRRRVEAGEDSHVLFVEYSIGPEDDIDNPEHWPRWMPALGYTISLKAVKLEWDAAQSSDDSKAEFYRAYGNGWTVTTSQIIPAAKWAAAYEPKTERAGAAWLSADCSPGVGGTGKSSSLAVASFRGDSIDVEVIRHGLGTSWLADEIAKVTRKNAFTELWIDPAGPIGEIVPDIKLKALCRIHLMEARETANACGRFHQAVLDRAVRHRNQEMLNAAVEGAAKRTLEDSWAWKRANSASDISPLVAVTNAHWAAVTQRDRGLISMHGAS